MGPYSIGAAIGALIPMFLPTFIMSKSALRDLDRKKRLVCIAMTAWVITSIASVLGFSDRGSIVRGASLIYIPSFFAVHLFHILRTPSEAPSW